MWNPRLQLLRLMKWFARWRTQVEIKSKQSLNWLKKGEHILLFFGPDWRVVIYRIKNVERVIKSMLYFGMGKNILRREHAPKGDKSKMGGRR